MPAKALSLPKDPRELALLMWRHATRCEMLYMVRRTNWLLAWYYLNGYRRFDVYNPQTGKLTPHYLDEKGDMEYQSQDLLYAINQVAGRIESMDTRLKIEQQGFSLEGQRNRSLAQIVGDSVLSDDHVRSITSDFAYQFACLGFAGIQGHLVDHPTIGLTSDLEVIHPKEIFPFPATGQVHTRLGGIMRQRWVSLEELKEIYGRKVTANLNDMEWYEVDSGEDWMSRQDGDLSAYQRNNLAPGLAGAGSAELSRATQGLIRVVRVRELWVHGPADTVARYAISSGDHLIEDRDLDGLETYSPIGWARFMNNGSFHGAGMFDLMFSVHRHLEQLSKSLFNNVMDLDKYGILVMPQGEINKNNVLRDVGRGLRVLFWDPDSVSEGFNPFPVQPVNTGDMPGRVAQFAREAMASVNPIQDLIQEKGRVDSASGLAFLDEQITRALTSPTTGVQRAFSTCYRSLVQKSLSRLAGASRTIPVGSLTLDLAGAIIDPDSNTVSFTSNPLPDISRLSFRIREVSPRSQVARQQQAVQLWESGIETDPLSFRMQAVKEGLDFPLWMDDVASAHEMTIRTILTLFNDGDTPGQIIMTRHTTGSPVFIRILQSFCAGPIMSRASSDIVDAFEELEEAVLLYQGQVMPNNLPSLEEAAMMGAPQLPPGQEQSTP